MPEEKKVTYRTDLRRLIAEETCEFASQIVKSWQDMDEDIKGFVTGKVEDKSANIPVSDIVGTGHPRYMARPWSYLVMFGERSDPRLTELTDNPDYYLSNELKHHTGFTKVGKDIYITNGGNHRAIIAKFFFFYNRDKITEPLLRNAPLTELIVDWHALQVRKEIDALLEQPRFAHLTLNLVTEHNADYQVVYRWHLFNSRLGAETRSIKLTRSQLPELLDGMRSDNFLRRFFGLGYSKSLRTSDVFCLN